MRRFTQRKTLNQVFKASFLLFEKAFAAELTAISGGLSSMARLSKMNIRTANPKDAKAISTLILSVAHYFTLHPEGVGADAFFETISESAIEGYIRATNFHYLAGFIDANLAGVVSIRDNKHLYHLFVSPQFQRRGLAREVWSTAMANAVQRGNPGEFTVNSSPYAVPVYASFGFETTGPRVETKGIAFVPMKYRRVSPVD